ncbi:cytochrome c biogenesis protein CcsA [Salipaludibacillus agaradhaerens]|uniref:Heme exporter protein C n=1 Tax=Salipaludibacillus agaradhaerens TaxID=76935 RepID=A0A9Q4FZ66_SALAG|nr:cytochrome c biogenesis protein [Salipaludibacillus agaradhaerens]MCR6098445.1 cytochrome c biogenesis protein CcsA [Salipaludibacillus agaradhaerens]MCR6104717.1 cytochrome c biogenesis protein CcsA [Salipaludibacillus agaradhaerens]MCR6115925.1 cytochrome c biogenesis protein CcsA [Salipaludibacillus agaradhaerens]MCR6116766.1 cytochrome c biogenesis protein CcsA [Salipaludibacillus agaradhaerens]
MTVKNHDLSHLAPSKLHNVLLLLSIPMVIISLYLVFIWSPVERVMGPVQKIFYFHVASAWNAFFAFFIVFIFSLLYIVTKKRSFDLIAGVSGEIGVIFTAIVLTTGPIWARSAWNTWWTWEPRLTTTLILFFMYVAYIMVRNLDMAWQKRARLAAVFGIIGFANVPIVYMSIRWWESNLHPVVVSEGTETGGGLDPGMLVTLIFTVMTLTLVYIVLLQKGLYVEKLKLYVQSMKAKKREKMIS